MDSLSQLLEAVRLESTVLSVAELRVPWAVYSNQSPTAIFHAVVSGGARLRCDADDQMDRIVDLAAGDVAILTQGSAHLLCDDLTSPVKSARDVEADRPNGPGRPPVVRHGGRGAPTRIICGAVRLARDGAEALLAMLPPVVIAPGHTEEGLAMKGALTMLDHELSTSHAGAQAVIHPLSNALFLSALRSSVAHLDDQGWLPAMRDKHIGRALFVLHNDLKATWSAEELGAAVGMSRSRFFKRFTDLVGEPPAQYLARVRAHAGADLLRDRGLSVAEVAERVGYRSVDAFTRVFRKQLGTTPREFRQQLDRAATVAAWPQQEAS